MKQIVDKLNKIAKKIDENVDIPNTDLITDSLDAITTALGGTPNDSNLIVDKLEDIAGVAHGGGGGDSPIVYIKVNITNVDPNIDLYDYDDSYTYASLLSYFVSEGGTTLSPYYETTHSQVSSGVSGAGSLIAGKDGGTGVIYLIPFMADVYKDGNWVKSTNIQIEKSLVSALTEVSNVTITEDAYKYYFELTDPTAIGEINISLLGYIPD